VRYARWIDGKGKKRTAPLNADGSRVVIESPIWVAKLRDGNGIIRELSTGCRDRGAAMAKLHEWEKSAEHVRAGIMSDADTAAADWASMPIEMHIEDYVASLDRQGNTKKHTGETRVRLTRLCEACRFHRLRDLDRLVVERWLPTLEMGPEDDRRPVSARSRNAYVEACKGFGNWALREGRVKANPFVGLRKENMRLDPRHMRRSMTAKELAAFLDAAERRPVDDLLTIRTGPNAGKKLADVDADVLEHARRLGIERALFWRTLAHTGLRFNEAHSLRVRDLALDDVRPHITLAAENEKSRRGARIPLRADLAQRLAAYLDDRRRWQREAAVKAGNPTAADVAPDDKLFPNGPASVKVFNKDLAAAGIPKHDAHGKVLDIHSLRVTFNSLMAAAGVPLATRQVLMRHSDPKLTAGVYTDPETLDLDGALAALPCADAPQPAEEPAAAAQGGENTPSPSTPVTTPNGGPKGQNQAFTGTHTAQRVWNTPQRIDTKNRPYSCGYPRKQGRLEEKKNGVPGGTRTPNLLVRSQTLYPIELRVHIVVACVSAECSKCRG
jgi:integrase